MKTTEEKITVPTMLKINKICWNRKLTPPEQAKKIHRIINKLLKD